MKPLTVAQVNQLRVLLKKATKPAPLTAEEQRTKRNAQRAAYKATVLAWAVADWHERVARLKISCPYLWAIGAGDCPTEYTSRLGDRYKRRNQFNY